jgi:hypothetical protein
MHQAAMYAGIYCLLVFGSRALKELQGLVRAFALASTLDRSKHTDKNSLTPKIK